MWKKFWHKYKNDIVETYMVAAVFFTCLSGLGMNWITAAICIGIANNYLVIPLVNALNANREDDDNLLKLDSVRLLKNVGKAILICSMLMVTYYYINEYLFPTYVEPISFGIFYKLIDIALRKLMKTAKKVAKANK